MHPASRKALYVALAVLGVVCIGIAAGVVVRDPITGALVIGSVSAAAVVWFVSWSANKVNIRILDQNTDLTAAVISMSKSRASEDLSQLMVHGTTQARGADAQAANAAAMNGGDYQHSYGDLDRGLPIGL